MKVTEKDVAYVADLANLELTTGAPGMLRDLNSILDTSTASTSLIHRMSRRWRRFPTATELTTKQGSERFAYAAAKIFSKDCASRCRTKWR